MNAKKAKKLRRLAESLTPEAEERGYLQVKNDKKITRRMRGVVFVDRNTTRGVYKELKGANK